MKRVKFATIGTSSITDKFLKAAQSCPDFEYAAAYSRTLKTAKQFAASHGAKRYYDSIETLVKDEYIDAVYVASPNALHFEQTMILLNAGKHVLCEKALASNASEAKIMVETARKNHLILMEAMRSLYDPGMQWIKNNLEKLSTVRRATFSFCQYSSRYDNFKKGLPCNIFSREMSAGALMDIGIYCVEPLIDLFGTPEYIHAQAVKLDNGIDGCGTILAAYPEMIAELIYSKITAGAAKSEIQGENGIMTIDAIACPQNVNIKYNDGRTEAYLGEPVESNMIYETEAIIKAIRGELDIEKMQDVSLNSMAVLDEARKQIGLKFPADL